jgi:putative tryptophan/tyrosine transport system substrate-binding protein
MTTSPVRRRERRSFLGTALLLLPALLRDARAHQAAGVRRIAYVDAQPGDAEIFRDRLAELGFSEPKNLEMQFFPVPSYPDIENHVRPAIAWKPHLVVAAGASIPGVRKAFPKSVPVVFTRAGDALMGGLVASLSRPGGNMTGVSWSWEKGKWLELACRLVPGKKRFVGLVDKSTWEEEGRHLPIKFDSTEELGVDVEGIDVSRLPGGVREVLQSLRPGSFDALLTIGSYSEAVYAPLSAYVEFQKRTRIPCIMQSESAVEQGAIMYRGPDRREQHRFAAEQAARILKGARAGELPVMRSTRFRVAVNRRAATEIGLKVPPDLLLLADRVID